VNGKTFFGVLVAGLTALTLAGCSSPQTSTAPGGTTPTAPAASSAHNAADVVFAQNMIPHHRQAVEMAGLVAGRSQNPQVLDLAARIGGAQAPEIQTMTGWLQQWGAEVPSDSGMMGGDHTGMTGMSGTMTPGQMQQLGQANGAGFDRMFLQLMTEHHTGAIAMAKIELTDGQDLAAKNLAQQIITAQQAEITEMKDLLNAV
jgi:uncharacterized protein (DUF305 family)